MNKTTLKLVAGETYENGLHHEGCICDQCLVALDETPDVEVVDEVAEFDAMLQFLRLRNLGLTDGEE